MSLKPHHSQLGFGMVEMLVAVVVLSIGMLGVVAMQVESVRANRSAVLRNQAITMINDLQDRILANRLARAAYVLAPGVVPAPADCFGNSNCDSATLARADLSQWVANVRRGLPADPTGNPPLTEVIYTAPAGPRLLESYQLRITWREPGDNSDSIQQGALSLIPTAP